MSLFLLLIVALVALLSPPLDFFAEKFVPDLTFGADSSFFFDAAGSESSLELSLNMLFKISFFLFAALEDFNAVGETEVLFPALFDAVPNFGVGLGGVSFLTGFRFVTVPDFLDVVIIETVGGLLPTRFMSRAPADSDSRTKIIKFTHEMDGEKLFD